MKAREQPAEPETATATLQRHPTGDLARHAGSLRADFPRPRILSPAALAVSNGMTDHPRHRRYGSHRRRQLPSPSGAARPRNLKPKSLPQKFGKLGKGVSPTDPRNVMAVENGRNQHPASRSWVLSAPISTLPVSPKPRKCLKFQMFIKKIRPARSF